MLQKTLVCSHVCVSDKIQKTASLCGKASFCLLVTKPSLVFGESFFSASEALSEAPREYVRSAYLCLLSSSRPVRDYPNFSSILPHSCVACSYRHDASPSANFSMPKKNLKFRILWYISASTSTA